ncbi:MAG: nucleotidyltransferase domain-containing protein [Bacteroidales bacterium]|nr:nucleotidyltransferase domain-containing protein [Bacteroidales bacterium]
MGPVKVYLYGSYSKGTAREDSDIDVAVVVPELNDDFLHASSLLWSLTWNVDASIEPVLIDARCPSPLYEDIIATGISV